MLAYLARRPANRSQLRYRGPFVASKYCESTMHPVYHAKIAVSTKNFPRSEGRKCGVKGLVQWRGLMVWSRSRFRWSSPQGRVEKGWNWVAECNNIGERYTRKNVLFLRWRGERYIPKNVFFLR